MNIDPLELKMLTPMAQLYFPSLKLKANTVYPKKPVSHVAIVDSLDRIHLGRYVVRDKKLGIEQLVPLKPAQRRMKPWVNAFTGAWQAYQIAEDRAELVLGPIAWPYKPGFELKGLAMVITYSVVNFDEYRTIVTKMEG